MRLLQVLAVGVLLVGLLPSQPAPGVRAGTWTQSRPADWSAGSITNLRVDRDGGLRLVPPTSGLSSVGSYTTAVGTADFPFTHLVARWEADVPTGTTLVVEIRARQLRGDWTLWMVLFDPHESEEPSGPANRLGAEPGVFAENLLALRDGREMQARFTFVTAHPQLSPILRSVSLIYLDASQGPTTRAAAAKALRLAPKTAAGIPPPAVIPRGAWGADESWMSWPPEYAPVQKIVVHHTVTENHEPDPAATVRAIYYYHAIVRGWGDIGYNYLVDRFGNIYEGRAGGPDVIGGHAYGYNTGSLGIGALGTFGNTSGSVQPTQAILDSVSTLAAWTASRRLFHPGGSSQFDDRFTLNIAGHRDYGFTACPGDYLYAALPTLRDSAWWQLLAYLPSYAAVWGEHTTPGHMLVGRTREVSVQVQNGGSLTWSAGGTNLVRLGYHWYDDSGHWVALPPAGDHRTPLPADAEFGTQVQWTNALVTAPETPGTYTLRWDMVHEGVTWFADQGSPTLDVAVVVLEVQPRSFLPAVVGNVTVPTATPVQETPPPTPIPVGCSQLIVNGGFEDGSGWILNDTPAGAFFTASPVHSGARALQVGIPSASSNQYSYSSADQAMTLPAGGGEATLSLWRYPRASDDAGDFQYIMLRDQAGAWYTLLNARDDTGTWLHTQFDLGAYRGQAVTLRIGAFNDGTEGVTSLAVDDVSLLVCP